MGLCLALFAYNLLFPVLFLLYAPFYGVKLVRRGNWRRGFGERFALYGAAKAARLWALDRPIWIHACSVGETVVALGLIRRWRDRCPGLPFVLSTTTTTGQQTARDRAPEDIPVIYVPLDWWPFAGRALRLIRPRLLVLMEKEFWPNLICRATARGVPLGVANGQLSDRSARGYRRWDWIFGPLMRRFGNLCVQAPADADRLRAVGGPDLPVTVCGSMKFDQVPDRDSVDLVPLLDRAFGPGPRLVFCAASTHEGEEAWVGRAFRAVQTEVPELRLVLVPRHAERLREVRAELAAAGIDEAVVLTDLRAGAAEIPAAGTDVLLVNTTGELMDFLAVADIVFVGKSLAGHHDGHNIIEPAIFAKPIITGNRLDYFRQVFPVFLADASVLAIPDDESAFAAALRELATSPERRRELGRAARRTVETNRGSIDRTIDELAKLPLPAAQP